MHSLAEPWSLLNVWRLAEGTKGNLFCLRLAENKPKLSPAVRGNLVPDVWTDQTTKAQLHQL